MPYKDKEKRLAYLREYNKSRKYVPSGRLWLTGEERWNWKHGKYGKGKGECIDCKGEVILKSERCKSCSKSGKLSSGWNGGITKTNHIIRSSVKYTVWRKAVFEKDNYTCFICAVRGGDLEVDHYPEMFSRIVKKYNIKSMRKAKGCIQLWDVANGRTLCKKCHKVETYGNLR